LNCFTPAEILPHQQAHCVLAFARVGHRLRTGRHRESRDFHHLWCIMIDRQRNAIVSGDVRRLLTVEPTEKIERETLVRITYRRRLRPTIRPQRRDGHDAVLIQQFQDLQPEFLVHPSSLH
jgi:hypothetical protein